MSCRRAMHPMSETNIPVWLSGLREVIDTAPLTVTPDASLGKILALQSEGNHTGAMVIDDGKLVGIFTLHDLMQLLASGSDLTMPVADVMTRDPISIGADHPEGILAVLNLFSRHRIRHLPVLDAQGGLVGLITPESIYSALSSNDVLRPRTGTETIESLQQTISEQTTQLDEANKALASEAARRERAELALRQQSEALAVLRERERMASALHEMLDQLLGYALVQAQTVREALAEGRITSATAEINAQISILQEAGQDIREFLAGARVQHNIATGPGSFYTALQQHLQWIDQLYGFRTELTMADDVLGRGLAPMAEVQLLPIIQEALSNVRRHAGVMQATINFRHEGAQLVVEIRDRGRGFTSDPSNDGGEEATTPGYGIERARNRAADLGGTIEIETAIGQGTLVRLRLPIRPLPERPSTEIRILLVDDNDIFLHLLQKLLSTRGFNVVGAATNGAESVALARELRPDVVLMDVEMPGMSGLDAASAILAELPGTRVVMLTVAEDDTTVFDAVRRGASGYLLKDLDADQISDRILGLMRGEAALSPGLAQRVLTALASRMQREDDPDQAPEPMSVLTVHQIKILTLLAQGYTYKEIGRSLGYSERAIKYHTGEAIRQLQLKDRAAAIAYARARMQRGTWPLNADAGGEPGGSGKPSSS